MGGEAFYGLHQVGDEVASALQGDIHRAPGGRDSFPLRHKVVTHADKLTASAHSYEEQNRDDNQSNLHESSPIPSMRSRASMTCEISFRYEPNSCTGSSSRGLRLP